MFPTKKDSRPPLPQDAPAVQAAKVKRDEVTAALTTTETRYKQLLAAYHGSDTIARLDAEAEIVDVERAVRKQRALKERVEQEYVAAIQNTRKPLNEWFNAKVLEGSAKLYRLLDGEARQQFEADQAVCDEAQACGITIEPSLLCSYFAQTPFGESRHERFRDILRSHGAKL